MTGEPEPIRYKVSGLPEKDPNSRHFTIIVEYRGGDMWAVMHLGFCLSRDGEWDWEPAASDRENGWLSAHRFSRDEALKRAKAALPELNVNGLTLAAYRARQAGRP